jgi:site-specific recombinase XerC
LQEDQQLLERNPVRGVSIPAQALLAPRELSEDQRYVIRDLVEREADLRGKAAFALGDFAGYRVSDVSWLLFD